MSENRYEITKLLGKGRTGGVYEAEDGHLNRKVAMRRFFDQGNMVDFLQHKDEFLMVAQSLSKLQHPNLLRVFDAGFDEDGAYVVSQLLEGESLHEETKKGAIELGEVIELAKQMLDAFSMAHDIGYFHGALTPDSILMVPRARGGYRYVILDMGLSRLAPLIQGKDSFLAVMADRAILSPELFDGGIADARADLYMLGQILFMCIAGGHPFGGLSVEEAKKKHFKGLPSLKKYNSEVPKKLAEWLETLTAVKPEDRPASAVEALRTLQQISSSEQDTSAQRILSGLVPVSGVGIEDGLMGKDSGPVPILPPGITPDDIQELPSDFGKSKSPTIGIVIALGALAAAIIGIILLTGGDSDGEQDDDTPSAFNEKSSKVETGSDQENTSSDISNERDDRASDMSAPIVEVPSIPEELVYFDGKAPDFKGWEKKYPSLQESSEQGWFINDKTTNSFTGIKFPLRSETNKMYDRGWNLSYKVHVGSGAHRIGFLLTSEMNPGWMDDGAVGCCVVMKLEGEKLTFYSPENQDYDPKKLKSHVLDYNPEEQKAFTLTIRQDKEAAKSDAYIVQLDGIDIYTDTFTNKIDYQGGEAWENHLFCSTLDKKSKPSWMIQEIKLQAL